MPPSLNVSWSKQDFPALLKKHNSPLNFPVYYTRFEVENPNINFGLLEHSENPQISKSPCVGEQAVALTM
jgi:hypothetical protein